MTRLAEQPAHFAIAASLTMQAAADGPPRFRMDVAYDGGKLDIAGFKFPVVVDLASVTTADQIKCLLHHDTLRPVGHFDRLDITDSISGEGVLSQDNDATREVIAAAKNGYAWEASIGATHDASAAEFIRAGQTITVNGREQTGPFILARNAVIREVSFVGAGGGENTSARIAAAARKWSDYQMATTIRANARKLNELITSQAPSESDREALIGLLAEAAGVEPTDVQGILSGETIGTDQQYEAFAKVLDVDASDLMDPTPTESESDDSANSESEDEMRGTSDGANGDSAITASLNTEIRSLRSDLRSMQVRQRVDELAGQYGLPETQASTIRANAITNRWDDREIELRILRESRANPSGMQPLGGQSGAPATQNVINAALCLTAGMPEPFVGQQYGEQTMTEVLQARWRGFGLHAVCHEYLRAHGYHVVGGRLSEDDFRHAIRLAGQEQPQHIRASGGFSTFSLPQALGDFSQKELLRSYTAIGMEVRQIAYTTSNTNFQPKQLFRISMAGGLTKVGRDGQLQSVDLKEDGATVQVSQYGRKLTVSYVDIRNDDASGLTDAARQFGALAARTVEEQAAIVLLSNPSIGGTPFFDASRGNYLSGAALSLAEFDKANAAFKSLKTGDGVLVTLDPRKLLVGPGNEGLARSVHQSTTVVTGTAGTTPANNPWVGMFDPVSSRFLANGAVANANGTQFVLSCDPSLSSPIAIAYLDGVKSPSIRTFDALPGATGMQWDAVLNFGVALNDPYSAVYHAGQ